MALLGTVAIGFGGCSRPSVAASASSVLTDPHHTPSPDRDEIHVLLYVGAGSWKEGLVGIRDTASGLGIRIAETRGGNIELAGQDALVVGGGWAPEQRTSLGSDSIRGIREFVAQGGGYVGICAGAYLAAARVRWEARNYIYPLQLFSGTAVGPVPDLPPWPTSGAIALQRETGAHPLQGKGRIVGQYFGGPSFFPENPTDRVLLRYPNGAVAALAFNYGKGRVVLIGPHLEISSSVDANEVKVARELLGAMLRWAAGR